LGQLHLGGQRTGKFGIADFGHGHPQE
jgi:hypothetical protein